MVTQGLVHCPDVAVDQVLHLWGEGLGVVRALAVPPEAAFLVVLHAEQPLLTHGHVEEGHHLPKRGHQAAPQLLVVHHQQPLAVLEPVQHVRGPPRRVAVDKVWPLCGGKEGGWSGPSLGGLLALLDAQASGQDLPPPTTQGQPARMSC